MIFDTVYRKLEKDLLNKRKDMASIIEIANSAYEERDKVQEKLAMLMKKAEREKIGEYQTQQILMDDGRPDEETFPEIT